MKASFIIIASSAASVMAGPLMKRVMTTTTSIETVYTTITLGDEPTPIGTESLPTEDTNPDISAQSLPTGGTSPDVSGPEGGYGNGGYDYGSSVVQPQPTTTSTPEVVVVTPTSTPTPEEPITTEEPVPEQTTTSSATPAATTAPTSGSLSDIGVHHHNIHRSNHSAPSMSWGEDYASYAATLAKTCKFQHNVKIGSADYGQNIAMTATTGALEDVETFLARSITEMWYNSEINLFPADAYGQASPSDATFESWGHYTQVIWEGSTVVGCAVQLCDTEDFAGMKGYFSVCNYYPAGNMFGAFDTNVKAPGGEATVNV